jgi:aspartyl-tRNA(Asn)/glutamyl-tRNA(Gln) amidotransferase subunit A
MKSIVQLAHDLNTGLSTSRALMEAALERIDAHRTSGGVAYISVDADAARAAAAASDRARAAGRVASPLAGLPVSIKDLFDVEGWLSADCAQRVRFCWDART